MPTLQTEGAERPTKALDGDPYLKRKRCKSDVAILAGLLLAMLAVIGGAAFFAWDLSMSNEQVANTTPQAAPPGY